MWEDDEVFSNWIEADAGKMSAISWRAYSIRIMVIAWRL